MLADDKPATSAGDMRVVARAKQRDLLLKVCEAKRIKPTQLPHLPLDLVATYVRDRIGRDKPVDLNALKQAIADLAAERK